MLHRGAVGETAGLLTHQPQAVAGTLALLLKMVAILTPENGQRNWGPQDLVRSWEMGPVRQLGVSRRYHGGVATPFFITNHTVNEAVSHREGPGHWTLWTRGKWGAPWRPGRRRACCPRWCPGVLAHQEQPPPVSRVNSLQTTLLPWSEQISTQVPATCSLRWAVSYS